MSIGLLNLGNSCYQNSVLQCLSKLENIKNFCLDERSQIYHKRHSFKSTPAKRVFLDAFIKLCKALNDFSDTTPIRPISFRKSLGVFAPKYLSRFQEDSHDYYLALIDTLHKSLRLSIDNISISGNPTTDYQRRKFNAFHHYKKHLELYGYSFVNDVFDGQYESIVKCLNCEELSYTYEEFVDLSVEIPKNLQMPTLYDCLDAFISIEKLQGETKYQCDKCKKSQDALKQLKIWKFPKVLIIHLKRFTQLQMKGSQKNNIFVKYPMILNVTKYLPHDPSKNVTLYDLKGVVNHSGSLQGGHYTSIVKNGDNWYFCNDAHISKCSPNKVVNGGAYMLFYELRE